MLKRAIERGEIAGGEKLPSKRALATDAGISVITVEAAYNQLIAEGYITSAERRGYFAVDMTTMAPIATDASGLLPICSAFKASNATRAQKTNLQHELDQIANATIKANSIAAATHADGPESNCAATPSSGASILGKNTSPQTSTFPYKTWARCLRQVITQASYGEIYPSHDGAGTMELRHAIADYLHDTRAMQVEPSQIVIGAGAQTLYAIIIQLLGRDKIYAAENPGYTRLKKIYELNDVEFAPINVDAEGISVDTLITRGAQVAHVMPQHHLPTGIVMSAPRRAQLITWAASAPDRYIIEDDYDCELRFAGRPIAPLAASDTSGRVIYTNTFTKTMGEVFRVGYMVLPPVLAAKFNNMLGFYSPTVGILDQLALADFIQSGAYARHVRRTRTRLKKATQAFIAALNNTQTPNNNKKFHAEGVGAGAHFVLRTNEKTAEAIVRTAAEISQYGVKITPISEYLLTENSEGQAGSAGFKPTTAFTIDCTSATPQSAEQAAKCLRQQRPT
jgi:GntR family transcriptional regulator/MocR family aminotransferase